MTSHEINVVTYNIHKGVQGVGPLSRLKIHDLGQAMEHLSADLICLQEVRAFNHKLARRFEHWPSVTQAEFLAPDDYFYAYQTNAVTRHGEHGNALLSRWPLVSQSHHMISDHRFEQRGLLHVCVQLPNTQVHVIVVHLGLLHGSRLRQVGLLHRYIEAHIAPHDKVLVAGDFNDWGESVQRLMSAQGFVTHADRTPTFPSRLPLTQLDYVFARGMEVVSAQVPEGVKWRHLSDHLPLQVSLRWSEP
jgi:endonuclease/exonuclease/phosphatase family metal-dependent hydrolase